MTLTDKYGQIGKPEEQQQVVVRSNPVELTRAAFSVWLPIALNTQMGKVYNEAIYHEAVQMLKPIGNAFANISNGELEAILKDVEKSKQEYDLTREAGLFVSAILNATALPMLSGKFSYENIGYRLGPEKILILQPGSKMMWAGELALGKIVNYGNVEFFAARAAGGVQINCNTAQFHAYYATGGIQLNYKSGYGMGAHADGGIQVNFGDIEILGQELNGGIQANLGSLNLLGIDTGNGFQINLGTGNLGHAKVYRSNAEMQIHMGKLKQYAWTRGRKVGRARFEAMRQPIRELADLFREVAALGPSFLPEELEHHDPESVKRALSYDWQQFESSTIKLVDQIKAVAVARK